MLGFLFLLQEVGKLQRIVFSELLHTNKKEHHSFLKKIEIQFEFRYII
jgi:hypothetical protein